MAGASRAPTCFNARRLALILENDPSVCTEVLYPSVHWVLYKPICLAPTAGRRCKSLGSSKSGIMPCWPQSKMRDGGVTPGPGPVRKKRDFIFHLLCECHIFFKVRVLINRFFRSRRKMKENRKEIADSSVIFTCIWYRKVLHESLAWKYGVHYFPISGIQDSNPSFLSRTANTFNHSSFTETL